jgi:ABC-type phosphate/phosphonate transport system permease subunit
MDKTDKVTFVLINAGYLLSTLFAIVLHFFSGRNNAINIFNIVRKKKTQIARPVDSDSSIS